MKRAEKMADNYAAKPAEDEEDTTPLQVAKYEAYLVGYRQALRDASALLLRTPVHATDGKYVLIEEARAVMRLADQEEA